MIDGYRNALWAVCPATAVEVAVGELEVWPEAFDLGAINVRQVPVAPMGPLDRSCFQFISRTSRAHVTA